jgi:rod shape-determining protein MreD
MSSADARTSRLRIVLMVIVGLVFAIVPLPDAVEPARPDLLLLLIIYWSLAAPRLAGLTLAWICGLAIDLLKGMLLGQHALAFLLIAFLTHKFQLRMRIFPIWHQTLTVFMLLALYQFLLFWIDGIIGPAVTTWARWVPVASGTVLWPLLVAVMDTWSRRRA